jgi:hypothetical protein
MRQHLLLEMAHAIRNGMEVPGLLRRRPLLRLALLVLAHELHALHLALEVYGGRIGGLLGRAQLRGKVTAANFAQAQRHRLLMNGGLLRRRGRKLWPLMMLQLMLLKSAAQILARLGRRGLRLCRGSLHDWPLDLQPLLLVAPCNLELFQKLLVPLEMVAAPPPGGGLRGQHGRSRSAAQPQENKQE